MREEYQLSYFLSLIRSVVRGTSGISETFLLSVGTGDNVSKPLEVKRRTDRFVETLNASSTEREKDWAGPCSSISRFGSLHSHVVFYGLFGVVVDKDSGRVPF